MPLRLSRKLETLSLPLAVATVILIGGVVYQNGQALRQARILEKQAESAILDLDSLNAELVDAETGQRGYLLTGRDEYLKPYNRALGQIRDTLARLKTDPFQGRNLPQTQEIDALAQAKLAELQQTIVARKGGDVAGALRIVNEGRGREIMDRFRELSAEMKKSVIGPRDALEAAADASASKLGLVSLGGSVFLFGLLSVAMVAIRQATAKREGLIQELKQSQLGVTRARDRFQTTLASIGDGVIVTDREGRITFLNAVAQNLTGWMNASAVGIPISRVFRIVNEDTRETVESPVDKVIRLGTIAGLANHTTLLALDGRETPIDDSAAPIRDADGALLGVVLVFRDISTRRTAEIAIHKGRADLERSHAALVQLNADLERFAYAASHDLQEPLRSIASFTELMARRPTTDEQTREYIRLIQSGVTRLETLIRDLLTYSQLSQNGGLDAIVDLREVLGETLFNLQASINETSATVSADGLPAVPGRRGQLVQLFQNIIGNAIKYRSERPPHIQISARPSEKNTWLFALRDNGIGIDMQYAELIFGVFKRLHSGREYPGTGIGLATCKRIVEIHRGTIWVESQAGEGSTFYFRLPALAGVADATMAGKAGDICV